VQINVAEQQVNLAAMAGTASRP